MNIIYLIYYSMCKSIQLEQDINMILQNKQDQLTDNNYNSILYPWYITYKQNAATQLINTMQLTSNRTYLWDNLKRIDQDTQLEWTMSNLQQIAVAYAVKPYNNYTNIHYQNITTFQILTDAIDFVLSNFYRADLEQLTPPLSGTGYQNQWQWQIAVPEILNNIVILIKDSISNNLLQKVVLSSRRFMPNASYLYNLYNPKATPSLSTGGNLVDTARICFLRGLISQNLIEADYSFHSLDHILDFVTTSDGFYKDYSFIQHRVIVASASYGYTLFNGRIQNQWIIRRFNSHFKRVYK
ncbi:polysaccharide_lyase 8 family protein [Hexamita inflata]|uniref:Polysaccharide_lyase 8 family protein n=1 Tax=Hexamita inflata TaxID=28002 RepID=A0ABP1HPA7_9EUKA